MKNVALAGTDRRPRAVTLTPDPFRARIISRVLDEIGYDACCVSTPLELVSQLEWSPHITAVVIDDTRERSRTLADFVAREYPRAHVTVMPRGHATH